MHRIAIVLAGGAGSRLGRDKAREPFLGSTLLDRVVTAGEAGGFEVLVVASERPPTLRSRSARVIVDPPDRRHGGPLTGFATGLAAAAATTPVALLLATDHPFLAPRLLSHLVARLESRDEFDATVPTIDGRSHPLVAAYRTSIRRLVETSLASGERSMHSLLRSIRVDAVGAQELREFDPSLRSFFDVDDETDLSRALELSREDDPDGRFQ